ncbi:DUF1189 domain-containing protein [Verrucomicrobia bacterium S94]|nr:DUF1189 domain-containing protein [Verrucomicrobia bacterium S94]
MGAEKRITRKQTLEFHKPFSGFPEKLVFILLVKFAMKTKKYNILQMPIMAFFSPRLYRDVGLNWKGANLIYLFLLTVVCSILPALQYRDQILHILETDADAILKQLPEIRIQNGIANVSTEMPCYINNEAGNPVAIIDTTRNVNFIDPPPSVQVMLTETKLIVRNGPPRFNKLDLSTVNGWIINQEQIKKWLEIFYEIATPLICSICCILAYLVAVMLMIFVATAGRIIAGIARRPLRFKDTMRLAVTASTPAVTGFTTCFAYDISIPGYIYPAVIFGYLLLAIAACSNREKETPKNRTNLKAALDPKQIATLDEAA